MGNKLEELRIAKSCLMWKCRSSTLFQRVGRAGQGRAGQGRRDCGLSKTIQGKMGCFFSTAVVIQQPGN